MKILYNSIDYEKYKAKKKEIKRKQRIGSSQMETKMELAKLKPIIDGKKKNLKYLRDNKGIAMN